jgi:hypothetical protein
VARAVIPQSVSAGLQLGLGLLMGVLGIKLILQTPWIGLPALATLILLSRIPRCPAAPLVLAAAALVGWASNSARLTWDQLRAGPAATDRADLGGGVAQPSNPFSPSSPPDLADDHPCPLAALCDAGLVGQAMDDAVRAIKQSLPVRTAGSKLRAPN